MTNYVSLITAKDGNVIPVLENNTTLNSKYSPLKEASLFAQNVSSASGFTVILGIAAGYHIQAFMDRFPESVIICVENTEKDIDFLMQIEQVKKLSESNKVKIICARDLKETLLKYYFPAVYGGINVIPYTPWTNHFKELSENLIQTVKETLNEISRDYSVQSHFGKLWHKNIFNNLKKINSLKDFDFIVDTDKTAAIIAAGPSFDITKNLIKDNQEKYCIISTDTAFSVLEKENIKPQIVVSIDPQNVSMTHFIGRDVNDILFVLDIGCNTALVDYIEKGGGKVFFIQSNHPLSLYARNFDTTLKLPFISSGSGTVTVTAADIARIFGFSKIEIFGADFSYLLGKAYTKGTYLDCLYLKDESRVLTSENSFNKLVYRTELTDSKTEILGKATSKKISPVMESYRNSIEAWFEQNNFIYRNENSIYYCSSNNSQNYKPQKQHFDYCAFIRNYELNMNEMQKTKTLEVNDFTKTLLPLLAFLRKKHPEIESYSDILKLARTTILQYN